MINKIKREQVREKESKQKKKLDETNKILVVGSWMITHAIKPKSLKERREWEREREWEEP